MQANSKMKAVARKSNRISVFIIMTVCIILGVALLIGKSNLQAKNMAYEAEEQSLQMQIDAQAERAKELDIYEKYVKSDEFVEKTAREKFGLVGENEYAIKAEN